LPGANGSARRSAAQADARPEGLARPRVAVGKDQYAATGEHSRPRLWLAAPSRQTSGGRKGRSMFGCEATPGQRRGRRRLRPRAGALPKSIPHAARRLPKSAADEHHRHATIGWVALTQPMCKISHFRTETGKEDPNIVKTVKAKPNRVITMTMDNASITIVGVTITIVGPTIPIFVASITIGGPTITIGGIKITIVGASMTIVEVTITIGVAVMVIDGAAMGIFGTALVMEMASMVRETAAMTGRSPFQMRNSELESCGAATSNIPKGLNHSARCWCAGAPCASTYTGILRKTDTTLSGLNDWFGRPPRVVPRPSGSDQPWAE